MEQNYSKIEVEELYKPGDPFVFLRDGCVFREVSIIPIWRTRIVFVGPHDQAQKENEAWIAAMGKHPEADAYADSVPL